MGLFVVVAVQVFRAAVLARRRPDIAGPVRRALRWWMWALAPIVLALVAVTAGLLVSLPGLDWGWGRLVGVDSNVALSPVTAAGEATGLTVRALSLVGAFFFLGLLAYAMPLFTLSEERIFRRGLEAGGVARWLRATVVFGLVHMIMGVPLGVALALSWGGAAFGLVYLRACRRAVAADRSRWEVSGWPAHGAAPPAVATTVVPATRIEASDRACFTSAAFHLAYNVEILGILAVLLALGL